MCINRQNTRETGGKELSVSLYFLDGIKYNETITEAGRNASIFYYEETARWAFMARRKGAGRNAAKSAGKGIVNHAAGGMAGSAVKKASGGASRNRANSPAKNTAADAASMKANEHAYEIGELDHYLFGQGNHYEIYKKLGAHKVVNDKTEGVYFAVWAPNAKNVSVVGEFNDWNLERDRMERQEPLGIYVKFVPEAKEGQLYKFCIETQKGELLYKADPFANYAELRPGTASRITDISQLKWSDKNWMEARKNWDHKKNPMSIYEKLNILSDAAKYDVACTSSGTKRKGDGSGMGNCTQCGICHSFSADGRCISLLKILFTNECIFDCKYCVNRRSNDVVRTSFTPDEVCTLTMEFYRRNYIEGLFLSSGILISPDYTMELICATLYKLRKECNFQGYIHVKAIPGASQELIQKAGFLADRMSVNLELPTAEGLKLLAPHKSRKNILAPMRLIQEGRNENSRELSLYRQAPRFVPSGQSTQMIIGATLESDYQIMKVTESLYKKFELKRVFYSAFVHVNEDKALPARTDDGPPLLREHRLYQADWLLRYYHFQADELLSEEEPNFNVLFDPKCNWALKHLEYFPVEINRADYEMLLRVPGLGYKSATRIVKARKLGTLDFADLKKLGVVLKRAVYFITCNGKTMYPLRIEEESIARNLLDSREKLPQEVRNLGYRQLSLFDDVRFRENFYEKDLCV